MATQEAGSPTGANRKAFVPLENNPVSRPVVTNMMDSLYTIAVGKLSRHRLTQPAI